MPTSYKQPRKLNVVSFVIGLALLAAAYAGWKWGPPYLQSWKVDEILHDGAAEMPHIGLQASSGDRLANEQALADKLRARIRALGIDDPQLLVDVNDDGTNGHVIADWTVSIHHLNEWHEPTPDHFHRDVVQPLHAGL